jgi:hypothetical protein
VNIRLPPSRLCKTCVISVALSAVVVSALSGLQRGRCGLAIADPEIAASFERFAQRQSAAAAEICALAPTCHGGCP